MTPGERWVQRVMGNLGARPVGHAEQPTEDDETAPAAPVVPIQPSAPAPDWPPAGARRISTTAAPGSLPAPGRTVDLADRTADDGDQEEGEEPQAEEPVEQPVKEDSDGDQEEPAEEAPAAQSAPPPGRITKILPKAKSSKGMGKSAKDDPSLRITVFNLSAAALGYGLSLAPVVEGYLAAAEHAARGVFELVLALAGMVAGWKLAGHRAVQAILPGSIRGIPTPPILWQTGAAAGAAEFGRRQAPLAVDWLNQHGQAWGLGPNAVSFLIVSGGIAFALWWFIDRKLRRFHWTARWICRVPLATAVVVTLRAGVPIT
ncbi:hypothetical protein [Streptomyces collinus]